MDPKSTCIAIITVLISTLCAQADETCLFDFESQEDAAEWGIRQPALDTFEFSSKFATRGEKSVVITTPEWKPGMNEWPVWDVQKMRIQDWSGHDRLMIDFTNPSDRPAIIRFKAADPAMMKKGSDQWPGWSETIQPRSHRRVIVPLDQWIGGHLDLAQIQWFQFYTARATPNYRLHIDNIALLKPGREPAALPQSYVQQIVDLRLKEHTFPAARKALNDATQQVGGIDRKQTVIRAWGESSIKPLQDSYDAAVKEANSPKIAVDRIDELGQEIDLLAKRADRLSSVIAVRQAFAGISPVTEYAVGWATSMDKVLPRDMPVTLNVSGETEISLARNEAESVQVVVIPFDGPLKDVRVEVGGFTSEDGRVLPAERVSVRVVGYVKTKQPEYEVDYVGWWPDPLLDFLSAVDIEPGDAQSFWVRVRTMKDDSPGMYQGQVRIVPANASPVTLALNIKIRDFVMPDASPIPIATQDADERFFNKYSTENWETLKLKVSDFLAEYYIDFDNIYRAGPPDFEILRRLRDRGQLKAFSLSTLDHTVFVPDMTDEQYQTAFDQLVSEIQPGYDQAKADGILKYAYIYGMDEVPVRAYPILKRVTDDVKKKFPDVPIMTTASDYTYGQSSGADSVDVWVPILHEYKPELAKQARQRGKPVWWYTCQTPAHPYPNIFTEYPAIEIRLLMGAMTAKYQPDGFLYYCTFRDQGPPRKTVDTGPFTEWDACAFVQPYNGEGYLAYPGKNGQPLASLRLENFRDGLEDYAYWKILEQTLRAVREQSGENPSPEQKAWLVKVEPVLSVPQRLVQSPHEFSTDIEMLYEYREQLAEAIESAGIAPIDPW